MPQIGKSDLFNGWFTGILTVLIIFRGFGGLISAISTMILDPMWGTIILVLAIIRLIAYIQVLNAKKIGVYLWAFVSIAISVVAFFTRGNDWIYLLLAPALLLAMFLFFQIRKNGISAWQVIFGNSITDTSTTGNIENGSKEDKKENVNDKSCLSSPTDINDVQKPNVSDVSSNQVLKRAEQIGYSEKKRSSFNFWILLPVILFVLGGIWLMFSNTKSPKTLGDYVYISYTPPNGVVHLDKSCSSNTIIKSANELYREKANYRGYTPNYDFCAKCISDEEMKQIEDSIDKYKELN